MSRPHISVLSSEVSLQRIHLPTPTGLVFGHQDGAVIGGDVFEAGFDEGEARAARGRLDVEGNRGGGLAGVGY